MTQPLRYAINVTLDGCVHHEAGLPPDAESIAFWTDAAPLRHPPLRPRHI